ncbi:4'-phosphopantetheinyl transferase family protein [Oceanimonas smirnovii]|uniref:4'-phosphopantetheinyl transferase family protein n=1 Tax=Oceanimonas smirnovii TaxID=264574 RepID=UPI003FCF2EC1
MSKNKDIFAELLICDAMAINSPKDAYKLLSTPEKQRLAAIKNAQQAHLYLLSRYLLRQRLGSLLAVPPDSLDFYHTDKGKPELYGEPLRFNLSHSGSLLALAISSEPVGVDLESRLLAPAGIQRLARRYLATQEQTWLAQSTQPASDFQQLWTIKEAVLKADGSGIANNLHRVCWQPGSHSARFNEREYRLQHWPVGTGTLTLASARSTPVRLPDLADYGPMLEITGVQPNLAINP